MGVRVATEKDLPALKEAILSGLSDDSVWQYCFPSAGRQEATISHVDTVFKRVIDKDNVNWLCFVVEAPKTHEPVSLAIVQTLHQDADQGSVADQVEQGKFKTPPHAQPQSAPVVKTAYTKVSEDFG